MCAYIIIHNKSCHTILYYHSKMRILYYYSKMRMPTRYVWLWCRGLPFNPTLCTVHLVCAGAHRLFVFWAQRICPGPRSCVAFRKMIIFARQAGGPPFVVCSQLLTQHIHSYSLCLAAALSSRHQRTRHVLAIRTLLHDSPCIYTLYPLVRCPANPGSQLYNLSSSWSVVI
jgi:hypothetical protein